MSLRTAIGRWFPSLMPRSMQRAQPLDFGNIGVSFGSGLGGQPQARLLLQECIGIANLATRALANRVGTIEPLVKVKRRVTGGTVEEEILDDHPLKQLLDHPHPNLSRRMLLRLTTQWLVTTGEAYWLKVGNGLGVPTELHPIPAGQVEPKIARSVVESYTVVDGRGRLISYPASEIVRVYLPDPQDLWHGAGYLAPMANEADSLKFSGQHWRKHYQNDATPKAVIETTPDANQDPTQDQRAAFNARWREHYHSRLGSNVGIPALLPLGYHLIAIAAQTGADVVPLLEHWRDNMLMNYGTPRSLLGQVVSGDRSSAETTEWIFDRHAVMPLTDTIADSLTLQLAGDFDEDIYVCFEEFAAADKEFVLKQEETDLKTFVRSVNQVREDRGLDPVEWGDEPVSTFGQQPYDWTGGFDPMLEAPDEPPPDDDEPVDDEPRSRAERNGWWMRQVRVERKWQPAMLRAMRQLFKAQRDSVIERLGKDEPRARATAWANLFDPAEWATLFDYRIEPIREAEFREVLSETLSTLGIDSFIFTDEMRRVLRKQGAALVTWANETTRKRIAAEIERAVAAGEGTDQIAGRIAKVFARRRQEARTIARTEVLKASSAANLAGYKASGVVERIVWKTSLDDAVRDQHREMEGVSVQLGTPFTMPNGELADAPRLGAQGSNMSPENAINCRCGTSTVLA